MKITELQHAIEAMTAPYKPLYDFLLESRINPISEQVGAGSEDNKELSLVFPGTDSLLDPYMLVPHSAQLAQEIQSVATTADFFSKFGVYVLAWNFLQQWQDHKKIWNFGIVSRFNEEGNLLCAEGDLEYLRSQDDLQNPNLLFLALSYADGKIIRQCFSAAYFTGALTMEVQVSLDDDDCMITAMNADALSMPMRQAIGNYVMSFWPQLRDLRNHALRRDHQQEEVSRGLLN